MFQLHSTNYQIVVQVILEGQLTSNVPGRSKLNQEDR